ncbi:hypothetical protein [Burkholderia ambifaria]
MSKVDTTAEIVLSVLKPGFILTAAEIRAKAPRAERVSETITTLIKRGRVRRVGVRHTSEGKTEVMFSSM